MDIINGTLVKRRRMNRTDEQLTFLIDYLSENKELAKKKKMITNKMDTYKEEWEKLRIHLNAIGKPQKSANEWIQVWRDTIKILKKYNLCKKYTGKVTLFVDKPKIFQKALKIYRYLVAFERLSSSSTITKKSIKNSKPTSLRICTQSKSSSIEFMKFVEKRIQYPDSVNQPEDITTFSDSLNQSESNTFLDSENQSESDHFVFPNSVNQTKSELIQFPDSVKQPESIYLSESINQTESKNIELLNMEFLNSENQPESSRLLDQIQVLIDLQKKQLEATLEQTTSLNKISRVLELLIAPKEVKKEVHEFLGKSS